MQTFKFHRSETNLFDEQHISLVYNQEMMLPFIQRVFSRENIEKQVGLKESFSEESRARLCEALEDQYSGIERSDAVSSNLNKLKDPNTYTVTTGHQLSLYTGPLYFVVKILHVIKQCELLNEENSDQHFVPVYWMASEDHDFEEIQKMHLFNRTLTWESDQLGPVGKFELAGLEEVKEALHTLFTNGEEEIKSIIDAVNGENYAVAMRRLVNKLFGRYGLIIIDGDDTSLKTSFIPIAEKELKESFAFDAVSITNSELKKEGIKEQVYAREINLFYIDKGIRSRIERGDSKYEVSGVGAFTPEEMLQILHDSPEKISPNVVLRPVYQELILPNVLYVGGGGEISYWLQLKRVFDQAGVVYPLIQVRNSIIWIDQNLSKRIAKFDLKLEDIFKDADLLKKEYIEANEAAVLDFSAIEEQKEQLQKEIEGLVYNVDATLEKYLRGEMTRMDKQIEGIKSKLIKTSKAKHESAMNAIDVIQDRLFPNGSLQERTVNFFNFCVQGNVSERLDVLYSALEPFEKDLIVIREV